MRHDRRSCKNSDTCSPSCSLCISSGGSNCGRIVDSSSVTTVIKEIHDTLLSCFHLLESIGIFPLSLPCFFQKPSGPHSPSPVCPTLPNFPSLGLARPGVRFSGACGEAPATASSSKLLCTTRADFRAQGRLAIEFSQRRGRLSEARACSRRYAGVPRFQVQGPTD